MQRASAADAVQFRLDLLQAASHQSAVGLYLSFAGAAGADAAAEALQVGPLSGEAGQQVLVLGQLDLQLALVGGGVAAEYVEDERCSVDDLDLVLLAAAGEGTWGQYALKVALLGWGELVVEDHDVGGEFLDQFAQLFQLALADVGWGPAVSALVDGSHDLGAGGLGEMTKLAEGIFQRPKLVAALQLDGDEDGAFRFRSYVNQPRPG